MSGIEYLKQFNTYHSLEKENFSAGISFRIMTNFTDGLFEKILVGMCLKEDIYPKAKTLAYKQYHLLLNNPESELHKSDTEVTFIFFDLSPFTNSAFYDEAHFEQTLSQLLEFAKSSKGIIVINNFLLPYSSGHGLRKLSSRLLENAKKYNESLRVLAESNTNIYIIDSNFLAGELGEENVRNLRNLYAFDMPFTEEFTIRVCSRWLTYIRALLGRTKKCIVLDLDNTLWGGILGEVGHLGISLGTEYPGNAFSNFQQNLLEMNERGIILAINSKNNRADVLEVFAKNKNMILKEENFAAIYANWSNKDENIVAIARELNIDVSSMVFLDDDPLNRDLVRMTVPSVFVPDFSIPPEEYSKLLLSLDVFEQLTVSSEDVARNEMYASERKRKLVRKKVGNVEDYIKELGITMQISCNEEDNIPRVSQLSQKTNQFNLTTHRYTEHEIDGLISNGALVYTAEVEDKYGKYGITNVAIVKLDGHGAALLDTFLMSCRVIGRRVEFGFLDHIVVDLKNRGLKKISAQFLPTAKNEPSREFLSKFGYNQIGQSEEGTSYEFDLETHDNNKK